MNKETNEVCKCEALGIDNMTTNEVIALVLKGVLTEREVSDYYRNEFWDMPVLPPKAGKY
jgi:hypothetical protein